jgi:uncharacterized protein (DUF697 family)/uncharacterized tellurite resistance protein B-like protein
MTTDEQKALLSILLMAAYADGSQGDSERAQIRRAADSLGEVGLDVTQALQDVLLKRVDVAQCAGALASPELRQLAYELAIGVIDSDGLRNASETRFLTALETALGLTRAETEAPTAVADALATVSLAVEAKAADTAGVVQQDLEKSILNYAIVNGALELLPQSVASMAIIPLQMKMVYRIGERYGFTLDRGHIKDFLATLGVGLTGQYLEEIGRKLIGGLFGKAAGRVVGSLGRGATGVAFSFATTYALGHVAMRYYAGGRTMTTGMLQEAFQSMLGQAKGLESQYRPQIEQQARTVDVGRLLQMVKST